jgi:hypothetical protein
MLNVRDIMGGAVAGLAATLPMTAVMKLGLRSLPRHQRYRLPPRQITMKIADALGASDELGPADRKALTLASHYAYGALMGGFYGATAARNGPGVPVGAAFGLGVWAANYLGVLPLLGILKPATKHPRERVALMIVAHLVWGSTTGKLKEMQDAESCNV